MDDPGREKAMLEEAPVDSVSELGVAGSSNRRGSDASAASLLSLPNAEPRARARAVYPLKTTSTLL